MSASAAPPMQGMRDELRGALDLPRVLGDVTGARPGPTIVLTGALHGNEPAGALAIRRVLTELAERPERMAGRVVGLCGNRAAVGAGKRFSVRDLNRRWYPADLARLAEAPVESLRDEDLEQRELADAIGELEKSGPLAILDLHTTSGASPPFVCFGDTLENRRVARALPMTAILGLEEIIDGAMLGYYADRGHVAISVEAGQHRDRRTIARHEATVWVALTALGALREDEVPELDAHRTLLAEASKGQPAVVEIRHRHVVLPGDDFRMLPGFTSFQEIREGEVVAHDRSGPVRAPLAGMMLMPRYQGQGEDGYFLVRETRPFWLWVSEKLRLANAERVVARMPGVAPEDALNRLTVDPKVARAFVVDLMHLCGYRRGRDQAGKLSFTRRAR